MSRHRNIILHPPEQCPEDWEQMKPTGCGRFCASCQKTVIDFTVMSDNQIINIFEKQKDVCGRIYDGQLNRELVYTPEPKKIFRTIYGRIAATLLIANAFVHQAVAQQRKQPVKTTMAPAGTNKKLPSKRLEGRVVQQNGSALNDIKIVVSCDNGTIEQTQTPDSNGKYNFDLDKRFWNKTVKLSIRFSGAALEKAQHALIHNNDQQIAVPATGEWTHESYFVIIYEMVLDPVTVTSYNGRVNGGAIPMSYSSTTEQGRRHGAGKIWSWIASPFKKIF